MNRLLLALAMGKLAAVLTHINRALLIEESAADAARDLSHSAAWMDDTASELRTAASLLSDQASAFRERARTLEAEDADRANAEAPAPLAAAPEAPAPEAPAIEAPAIEVQG